MRFIRMSKCLGGLLAVLSSVAVVTGCHTGNGESDSTLYAQSSMGASTGATSAESSTQPAQASSEPLPGQTTIPLYEEQLIVGTRDVESGGVRLRKKVTTETVSQPVQVRRETLVIDREAASGGHASSEQADKQSGSLAAPFEEGEIVIRLHNQEPVVEKRLVPSGRIIVQTRTNTQQMNVQREVRRERIDVEKMGDGQNVIISEKVGAQTSEAVGAAPVEQQEIKGKQSKQDERVPVTTEEDASFPRPQPDGRETFPNLNKSPERQ